MISSGAGFPAFPPFGRADKPNIPPPSQFSAMQAAKSFREKFAPQLVLTDLPQRVKETSQEKKPESIIFDEVEPVEVWRPHENVMITVH